MTPADIAVITRAIGPVMRDVTAKAVADAMAPLLERNAALELRILELETRPAVVGPVGPVGPAGAKGDPGAGVASLVVSADGRLLAHLTDGRSMDAGPVPKGEKGDSGARGESGPQGPQGFEGTAGERGEKGEPGERGRDGVPGDKGLDGKDGASVEDLAPLITKYIQAKIAEFPIPRDGKDGAPGVPGERGPQGEKGIDGQPGRDGRDGTIGPAGAAGEKGTDGRHGTDGRDGKDGRDGLGFDDADLVLDETRGWILRLVNGDDVKDFPIPMPFFKGNWEAGTTYPKGAGVRWDGHYWWALTQTHTQPGDGSTDWQIVVSRGKQGREGKQGKDGAPGRDLTQMDPATGRKW